MLFNFVAIIINGKLSIILTKQGFSTFNINQDTFIKIQ